MCPISLSVFYAVPVGEEWALRGAGLIASPLWWVQASLQLCGMNLAHQSEMPSPSSASAGEEMLLHSATAATGSRGALPVGPVDQGDGTTQLAMASYLGRILGSYEKHLATGRGSRTIG